MDRLSATRGAWETIKLTAFIDKEIKKPIRIELRNAAIYSIRKYGLRTMGISAAVHVNVQHFATKWIRDIVAAGTNHTQNPLEWKSEHETHEIIRRTYRIPTVETQS